MPTPTRETTRFVFKATDPAGRRAAVEAFAANASAARYRLEIQGYTDFELISDDLAARTDRAIDNAEVWQDYSTEERQRFEEEIASGPPLITTLWQVIRAQWWLILLLTAAVAWRATGGTPLGLISWIIYALAAFWLWITGTGLRNVLLWHKLEVAKNWHRWDEALSIVAELRKSEAGIPEFALLFTEAKAKAARGEIAAAVSHVEPVAEDPNMDHGMYLGLLSGVYEAGRDFANSTACLERALALRPESPTAKIDVAFAVAHRNRDYSRANALLDEVDPDDVPRLAHCHVGLTRAFVALSEGRLEDAETLLRQAERSTLQTAGIRAQNGMAMLCEAYLAITLRRQGRETEAVAVFTKVGPWLRANHEQEIIDEWNAAKLGVAVAA